MVNCVAGKIQNQCGSSGSQSIGNADLLMIISNLLKRLINSLIAHQDNTLLKKYRA